MCNYKLKISITWSTIYAVTALSKWALPCLIQVENSCLWGFLIHSASCLLVRFSLSLLLRKWKGNSFFKKQESQGPRLLMASSSWLLTVNRAVTNNPQDCTSGGRRMETQPSEPHELYLCESFGLSHTAPQISQKAPVPLQITTIAFIYFLNICDKCHQPISQLTKGPKKKKAKQETVQCSWKPQLWQRKKGPLNDRTEGHIFPGPWVGDLDLETLLSNPLQKTAQDCIH